MAFDPTSYRLLSFDIYGTLIDWETGIYTSLFPLLSRLPKSSPHHPSNNTPSQNRHFLLTEYTKFEQSIQKAEPTLIYPLVLTKIYTQLAASLSVSISSEEATTFGTTIGAWPAFPDTVAAMKSLSKHYKLVVLSNVDKASFSRTLSGPLSGVHFDAIYTAEDIGSYKPDLKNFTYLVEHAEQQFGIKKEEILKVAQSLFHDHMPAKKFGLRPSVWIHRTPGGEEALMGSRLEDVVGQVDLAATFGSLGEFAEAVEERFEKV
jgi:2-haloalkanoic acid dehalogenase type II